MSKIVVEDGQARDEYQADAFLLAVGKRRGERGCEMSVHLNVHSRSMGIEMIARLFLAVHDEIGCDDMLLILKRYSSLLEKGEGTMLEITPLP